MSLFIRSIPLIVLFFLFGCMQQFSIPDSLEGEKNQATFGAGDTTFLQLNPVWDSDYGITDPTEISIAQDGRIFIADSTSKSIIVLDQNGNLSEEISGLNNLKESLTEMGQLVEKYMNRGTFGRIFKANTFKDEYDNFR